MTVKALEGLRVVEYANLRSGPYCARLLADFGAEVIKVEDPAGGDESRRYGPFPNDIPHPEKSGLFLWLNANKKGITLNIRSVLGQKILRRLLKETDIFVQNFPPATARELGLDYETLKQVNPQLIVTSITPFGQTGPYKDYKAYEINCCGAGGVSVASGEPVREPIALPIAAGEYQAGVSAAAATLVAVLGRDNVVHGQHIDISEIEVLADNHVSQHLINYIYRGIGGIRRGHVGGYFTYPNSCLPCKDGYTCLIAPQVAQWVRFVELIGNPEWSKNPRYRNRRAMLEEYPDEADALLLPWLKEHTKEEIFSLCREHHIPFAPEQTMDEVVNDAQLEARGFFFDLNHPEAGMLKYPGAGYELSQTPPEMEQPAPLLGKHNREIFCGRQGYSEEELVKLQEYGII